MEKSPPNAIRSRWLQSVFKNSYFIGLSRDGRAVAEGIYRRRNIPIVKGIAQWIKANTIMLDDSVFLKNFKLVRYEDLVDNPSNVIRDLFHFIGVDPEECQIDFQSKFKTSNIDHKNSPIINFNQKSFDRIPPDVFKEISVTIQPVMKRLGYLV